MFCRIVKKIALYIFWNCLEEEERQRNMKEHHYSKIQALHIVDIEDNHNKLISEKDEIEKELIELKVKINDGLEKEEILSQIDIIIKGLRNV